MSVTTRHPQGLIPVRGEFIEVDEELADILVYLNRNGCLTMFSCQGDEENPSGYIAFAPGVVFQTTDRLRVENLVGLTETAPVHELNPEQDSFEIGYVHWRPPRDRRWEGGQNFGWTLYFGVVRSDRCAMCNMPLLPWDIFSYHERCVH